MFVAVSALSRQCYFFSVKVMYIPRSRLQLNLSTPRKIMVRHPTRALITWLVSTLRRGRGEIFNNCHYIYSPNSFSSMIAVVVQCAIYYNLWCLFSICLKYLTVLNECLLIVERKYWNNYKNEFKMVWSKLWKLGN